MTIVIFYNTGVYYHNFNDESYLEHSVATFSWLQGNFYPAFGLLALRARHIEPINLEKPSFELDICQLPSQMLIYYWYMTLAAVMVIWTLLSRNEGRYTRLGKTVHRNSLMILFHTVIRVIVVYLVIIGWVWNV